MKLYFVRHGQTNANASMLGGAAISELDEPLNAMGQEQARQAAQQLQAVQFDAIMSSPLKRAVQTAEIINTYHGLPIQTDSAWRERDTGAYMDSDTWNDLFDFDKNIPVQNGESLADFFGRVYAALDALRATHHGKTVLVVSHGGVQHAVYAYAHKLALKGNLRISPMHNCEVRIYDL